MYSSYYNSFIPCSIVYANPLSIAISTNAIGLSFIKSIADPGSCGLILFAITLQKQKYW